MGSEYTYGSSLLPIWAQFFHFLSIDELLIFIGGKTMRPTLLLLLLSLWYGCADNGWETRCLSSTGKRCVIGESGVAYVEGLDDWHIEDWGLTGNCKSGVAKCVDVFNPSSGDADKRILCEDYLGPVAEACNDQDDDCDGEVDEDFDKDRDGVTTCDDQPDCWDDPRSPPKGLEDMSPDNAKDFNPFSAEVCDGRDNNCSCYSQPAWIKDSNRDGLECACSMDPNCVGEDCCDEGVDEDITPQMCSLNPNGAIRSKCQVGRSYCNNGEMSPCVNDQTQKIEICNGLDDDCNGKIDDSIQATSCGYSDEGACKYGTNICVSETKELICIGATYPGAEGCNRIDDDCDGLIDEGLWQECNTMCGMGIEKCWNGFWVECTAPEPEVEICDGLDNDCDRLVDEEDPDILTPCECSMGESQLCNGPYPMFDLETNMPAEHPFDACGMGVKYCVGEGEWSPCYFLMPIEPETCNAWDDDCDGVIDGMSKLCWTYPNDSVPATNVGECQTGHTTCDLGVWGGFDPNEEFIPGLCTGEIWPQEEVCDELDNDCDGKVDEDLVPREKVDMLFLVDGSGSMESMIHNLKSAMATYANDFKDAECPPGSGQECHRFALSVFPGHTDLDCTAGPSSLMLSGVPRSSLVTVSEFQSVLSSIPPVCAEEPSYDVMYDALSSTDVLEVGWRSDAYPYVIMITDEPAQTWTIINDGDVGNRALACGVGSCFPGDSFETFVITAPVYFTLWEETTMTDSNRLKDIWHFQSSVPEGIQILREIFQNVCLR